MRKLGPSSARAYEFIKREWVKTGEIPKSEQLRQFMGWRNTTSAAQCLDRIAAHGLINKIRIPARTRMGYKYRFEMADPLMLKPGQKDAA